MLTSQIEIVKQGQSYLSAVSQYDYTEILSPHFISSAGVHMRHIIDHYIAIMRGIESGLIDYDIRSRNSEIENCPINANEQLECISQWIKSIVPEALNQTVMLSTEVSVTVQKIKTVPTSFARELIFAGSHAVHHYAMIAQISTLQNNALHTSFGLAPATASLFRQQAQRASQTN